MKNVKLFLVIIFLILGLGLPSAAAAKPTHVPLLDDKVVIGGTFTLHTGETLDGDLVIVGGTVSLHEGSTVTGDVLLIGGNLSVEGLIQKGLVALGGVVELGATAVVQGDLIAPGAVLRRDPNATIGGDFITDSSPLNIEIPRIPNLPNPPAINIPERGAITLFDGIGRTLSPISPVFGFMFRSFSISAVAVFVMLILPAHTQRASRTLGTEPVVSGGFGLLTLAAAIPVSLVLTLTIVLIPFALLILLALAVGLIMGWFAVGHEFGRRIGNSFRQAWPPAIEAGIGTLALMVMIGSFNLVLWGGMGAVLGFLIASIGLGAVLITRFGSREYVPSSSGGRVAPSGAAGAIEDPGESVDSKEKITKLESKSKTEVKTKPKTKPKGSRKTPGEASAKRENQD